MDNLERHITDSGFVKLSAPLFKSRAASRLARGAANSSGDIADAGTSAGIDGAVRTAQGEAANRGIEAGGQALTNYGTKGTSISSAGTVGAQQAARSSKGSTGRAAARRIATKGPVRSVSSRGTAPMAARLKSINAAKAARNANRAARAGVRPAARAGSKATVNAVQKTNLGRKAVAKALGRGTIRSLPLMGVGVDMALDGPKAALKENFSLRAPETDSLIERAARAGGDLLTAGAMLTGNPLTIPTGVPAAARTADRVAYVAKHIPAAHKAVAKKQFNRDLSYARRGRAAPLPRGPKF